MTDTTTISPWKFADQHNVTMRCTPGRRVPARDADDNWEHDAYRVRLMFRGKPLVINYRKGVGHRGSPPELNEVIFALAMDSRTARDSSSYEEFARELGYDVDSRAGERVYNAVVEQNTKIRRWLDADAYEAFLTVSED